MTAPLLGEGPEFDRIRAFAAALGTTAEGIGDDCAVLGDGWCASTDATVEGVHFRRGWLAPEEVGWRAAMAALSDLAAMGASAEAVLVALVAPGAEPAMALTAVMTGVGAAAAEVGARVVGGDLTAGPALMITTTVLGKTEHPVFRRGARVGDDLCVTGALGGARAAWVAWDRGSTPTSEARAAFARPLARIGAGQWLAANGAKAMIDVSDGLAGDAGQLAAASRVGLEIEVDRVPVHPGVTADDPTLEATLGGEDYELLVALPAGTADRLGPGLLAATGVPLTRIGRVVAGSAARFRRDGCEVPLQGFSHFR
jgi:thiamine-monophosphate kinase